MVCYLILGAVASLGMLILLLGSKHKTLLCTCRTSPAPFLIPYDQYEKSSQNEYSIGMRFRMYFEGEEGAEKR